MPISESSQLEIDGGRKTSRKKRKRPQQEPPPTATLEDAQVQKLIGIDAIYAACESEVRQGFDYPQHEGCVPILNSALAHLCLIQTELMTLVDSSNHAIIPNAVSFDSAMGTWKGETTSSASEAQVPIAWGKPTINAKDTLIRIDSANSSWLVPRFSSFIMVRKVAKSR
jgi:hypothetical protein